MKGIMKKLHIMLLCVVLVGATMGFHTGEVVVKAKSKAVLIATNYLIFDWDDFTTKSVVIKCDYECVVDSSKNIIVNKTKLNAGANTLKITISKEYINPLAVKRGVGSITVTPVVNGKKNKDFAKKITVEQKGHGYKDKIVNTINGTIGGWAVNVGVFSCKYHMSYSGYFIEKNNGKKREFGKHEIYYTIDSSVKTVPYLYYDPNTITIKGSKQDSDKNIKNKYEYTMRTEYPGNYVLCSGDELHIGHKACYKKLKVDSDTDKKATASFMVHVNGYSKTVSISTPLKQKKWNKN